MTDDEQSTNVADDPAADHRDARTTVASDGLPPLQPASPSLGQRYVALLWRGRRWIIAAAALFVLGVVLGLLTGLLVPSWSQQRLQDAMTALRANVGAVEPGSWRGVLGIFVNNVRATLVLLTASAFFGLTAALGLLANGALLGLLIALSLAGSARVPLYLLPLGILPHGIVEIPAFLVAGAWGLRLGLRWLAPDAAGRRGAVWRRVVVETLWLVPLLVVLFAIAAVIEIMVTGVLLRGFVPAPR